MSRKHADVFRRLLVMAVCFVAFVPWFAWPQDAADNKGGSTDAAASSDATTPEVTVTAATEANSEDAKEGEKASEGEGAESKEGKADENRDAKDKKDDKDTKDEKKGGKPEKIAVNLNNVEIDKVMQFITELTGKTVVKHKDVKAQLTVQSPAEVAPEKAFALICDALLLEKVAVIEGKDSITLVPVEMLSDVVVDLMPPGEEEVPAGFTRALIPVRFSDVEELEKLLKPLLSKNGSLVAHKASKKILVTDTASRVANIQHVVSMLDVLDTESRQVQVFSLKFADAEIIAPIVKSVLGVLVQKEGGQKPGGPEGQPQPQPREGQPQAAPGAGVLDVLPYKEANWLVVVAPKEILASAVPLVEELDRDRPKELSLRLIPIQYADADDVAKQLNRLFEKSPEKRLKDTVEVTAHARSSSLVILSSEENFELIKEIVKSLDTEESVQLSTKTYELTYADAEDIAKQMNDLYQGLQDKSRRRWWWDDYGSGGEDEKTRFVPERRTNSIIAIARPTEFVKIEELVAKLDVPIDVDQVAPRIYRIKYVDATEMCEVLNKIFGVKDDTKSGGYWDYWYGGNDDKETEVGRLYGKVKFVPETTTNAIIVTTNNTENFTVIEKFVQDLDQFNPEAANTMVVRLQNAKADQVAAQLNRLFAREGAQVPQKGQAQQQQGEEEEEEEDSFYSWMYGGQKKKGDERPISNLIGQVRVVPDKRTNSLAITTAVQNFPLIEEIVEKLDTESPKVLVRVRLVEITTTKSSRIGTRFTSDESVFEADDFDEGIASTFGMEWNDVYKDGTIAANSKLTVGLLVQFLQRNVDTRILSEPTIVMNNNEDAKVFVGSQIPFITASQSSPEGSLNQSFEYKDAGTTLTITPNINELNKVEMKVGLEASQIRPGEVLFGGYIIDTRKFDTEVAVNSGDTIVIGGIMRESDAKTVRGVPILRHIPGVNLAFRKKDTKRENTELIAFITPTVLRDSEADTAVTEEAADKVELSEWHPLREDQGISRRGDDPWWRRRPQKDEDVSQRKDPEQK